jgi:hypothetical protein
MREVFAGAPRHRLPCDASLLSVADVKEFDVPVGKIIRVIYQYCQTINKQLEVTAAANTP